MSFRNALAGTLALLSFSFGSAVAVSAPVQWTIASGGNGHYYEAVFANNPSWTQAAAAAASMSYIGISGYLATFTTSVEQAFVIQQLGGGAALNSMWLGAYQDTNAPSYSEPGGGWKWVTGEPWMTAPNLPNFSFNNTYFNGSSEEFAITWWNTGGINDYTGTPSPSFPGDANGGLARGYIVEYSVAAVPEASTWAMLILGFAAISFAARRSARKERGLASATV